MKKIVYMGAGTSGRSENLRFLAQGTPLKVLSSKHEGTIVGIEASSAFGPAVLLTSPGIVFDDTIRGVLVGKADAIVFVTDGRPHRLEATIESWQNLEARFSGSPRPPIVIQHNFRDAPFATPIPAIEEAMGIEPFFVGKTLRVPNPIAALYPFRVEAIASRGEGVRETFEFAARAANGDLPKPDPHAAQFGMAMLDKQIASQLAASAPSVDLKLAQQARKSEAGRREFLSAAKQAHQDELLARLPVDEALQQEIAAKVREQASRSVLHNVVCPGCGFVEPSFEIGFAAPGAHGPFVIGGTLPVDPSRIDPDEYFAAMPHQGGALLVLDCNQCIECHAIAWLGVSIVGGSLQGVWPVALTRATLGRCHFVHATVAVEAGRLTGRDPHTIRPAEILAILWERLPARTRDDSAVDCQPSV